MQTMTLLTDVQQKFLNHMNAYHQSISNDIDGKYKFTCITDLRIDKQLQSLIVTFQNNDIYRYSNTGSVIKIK